VNEAAFTPGFVFKAFFIGLGFGILIGMNVDQCLLNWLKRKGRKGLGEK